MHVNPKNESKIFKIIHANMTFSRTIDPQGLFKETTIDILLETFSYIMKRYSVDFEELNLEYMINIYNLTRNFSLLYSNFLTYMLKAFHTSLEVEDHHDTQISTINESTLKASNLNHILLDI